MFNHELKMGKSCVTQAQSRCRDGDDFNVCHCPPIGGWEGVEEE